MSTDYEEALICLSSLITRRTRADRSNKGDSFDLLFEYLKILDLEAAISSLNVIHVAGTKGKGSTCTFTESIIRSCGFRTGLFTSPHLIDVRERFRLDGFLALLAFRMFSAERVDAAIMEVGLGGKFDATNVVQEPIVCGISSLGYDHMEILGYTLEEIAGEKAGIFKKNVPAYVAPQPESALHTLEDKASQLGIPLHVVSPLDPGLLKGQHLGLAGEHQFINAGLAVALSTFWLTKTGNLKNIQRNENTLPEQFIRGLSSANLEGRAQIIPDRVMQQQNSNNRCLTFYLDGAHSPESLEVCAKWFSTALREDSRHFEEHPHGKNPDGQGGYPDSDKVDCLRILLFNCMSVRDPQVLLPCLLNTCLKNGVKFHKAIFVPNQSVFNKVSSHASPPTDSEQVDLSWQLTLQRVWDNLCHAEGSSSLVFPSLPVAIKWLRESAQQGRSIRFQVLVTGSLHLVGDVLRLIKK